MASFTSEHTESPDEPKTPSIHIGGFGGMITGEPINQVNTAQREETKGPGPVSKDQLNLMQAACC